MPQTFSPGDLVATPLPPINAIAAKSESTKDVKFAGHNVGFVWVAPPIGTKPGMTLCVALRVTYDCELAHRVEAYRTKLKCKGPIPQTADACRSSVVPALLSAPISTSVMSAQHTSEYEEDLSSTDTDSTDDENETESCRDATSRRPVVKTHPDAALPPTAPVSTTLDIGVVAFASNYLRTANISQLANIRASVDTTSENSARNATEVSRQRQQHQRQLQPALLGGGRNRHASGSLVGGFAPSEWKRR